MNADDTTLATPSAMDKAGPASPKAPKAKKATKAKPKAKKTAKKAKGKVKKAGKINSAKERLVPAKLDTYTVDKKVRTAGGNPSVHNGDKVAKMLVGKTLDETYSLAAKHVQDEDGKSQSVGQLKTRYKHLNPGMQRMNLGNRLRAAL